MSQSNSNFKSTSTFQVNDRVEALWHEDRKWYPAEVLQVKSQNIFHIRFDGYVEQYDYTKDFLRVPEQTTDFDSSKPANGTRSTGCSPIPGPHNTTFTHTVTSESLREEGNVVFKNALSLAPVLRRSRLNSAKELYARAFAAALNPEERTSAQSNIAAVYRRLLEMGCDSSQSNAHTLSLLSHASMSITYGSEQNVKSAQWLLGKKLEVVKLVWSHSLRRDAEKDFESYIGRLYRSAFAEDSRVLIPEVRLILLHAIFRQHFLQAVRLIENSDHLAAIQQLEDSRRSSIEAETLCRQHPPRHSQVSTSELAEQFEEVQHFVEIESDLAVLREDCLLQMSVARSGQMIMVGDELLHNAVFGSATLSTCGVYDAIDCFRQAIAHARGVDIEHEAWAKSRLGHTFSKVLKQPANGHKLYKECIQLVLSLYPRRSDSKPWFIEANEAVRDYQQVMNSRDQAETEKQRAPILQECAEELRLMKAASAKGADECLTHVYATYGCGGPSRDTGAKMTKQLLKAICLFHPDKCPQDDIKKKTIREEIVKSLNHHYTVAKESSDDFDD